MIAEATDMARSERQRNCGESSTASFPKAMGGRLFHPNRGSGAMNARDARLRQFFGGYFNQDWDIGGARSWTDVVAQYGKENPKREGEPEATGDPDSDRPETMVRRDGFHSRSGSPGRSWL
jgi:hypothetical protein